MREKHFNEDFTNQVIEGRTLTGYYSNCNFKGVKFTNVKLNCVWYNCDATNADFRFCDISRLHSPKTKFANAKFKKPAIHTPAHTLMGKFNYAHNHEIIAEVLRQWIVANSPNKTWKTRALAFVEVVKTRVDLSWAEMSRLAPDNVIEKGFYALKDYPPLYEKILKFRTELEPEELKNARLNNQTK